jgi:colanic acid/amylovoran biosynthesis glycosyltransferase
MLVSRYPLAVFVAEIGARTETFIRRHVQELLPGGTVTVGRSLPEGRDVDWAAGEPFLDLDRIAGPDAAARFLRDHGVEVLMGEYLDESVEWLDVAHAGRIRFFGHAHGYDVTERLREPRWRSEYLRYAKADGVITMSECSRRPLLDLGLPAEKLHVVPYGVDVPDDPPQRPQGTAVRLVAVGRMIVKKGPLLTLEAFGIAARADPALRLDYVGAGPLHASAVDWVRERGLGDSACLLGSQPNDVVRRLMAQADIFVQHSIVDVDTGNGEGLPVAILEAMASALPVVATRHAGIPEAVLDGTTGYLVEEGDYQAMADAISLLAREPDRRRDMGLAGWRRAREFFSWERERNELLRILGLAG